jgi:endonuclease/exonuclease/phosphatase family metal-dependent hydrolase
MRFCVAFLICNVSLVWAASFHELDNTSLIDSPYLRHLALAIGCEGAMTARELVHNSDVIYITAPDPTQLLQNMQRKNQTKSSGQKKSLRLLSYNVALLDANAFGIFNVIKTPLLEERRQVLPESIFTQDADIVFLQEAWIESTTHFLSTAQKYGYKHFIGERQKYDDGLMILVKDSLIDHAEPVEVERKPYETQYYLETYSGAGKLRALLRVSLDVATLGRIHLYNTHLLSFRLNWQNRMLQARELGRHIAYTTTEHDLVFVGGDINAGPYYRDDEWAGVVSSRAGDWWRNAAAYPLLLHYGQLDDLMIMGLDAKDADVEVRLGKSVPNQAIDLTKPIGAYAEWCKQISHVIFTATDCNSLHLRQYPGFEQPARQDHLFVRDPEHRVRVKSRSLVLTERFWLTPDIETELSDHYGVLANISVELP